ncbi:hypothetical protein [uncultured Anaerofustis sp.]|uniref:hypothetical protein n=1 Tax=uncultured Anaerofustis sp. TaxID=904996 RepID=UPI0025FA8397|nr:hypothetical protein [uncultured Anaerofustis sp.]
MNRNSVSGDIIDLNLRQLGGKVSQFNSQMHLVEFDISEDCVVSYIFTITNQDKFYLQRIKPYPLSEEKYSNVQQIVEFIKKDIDKFKNATNSKNFNKFIEIAQSSIYIAQYMEDLFLNYNVDREMMDNIEIGIKEIMEAIQMHNCKEAYRPIKIEEEK